MGAGSARTPSDHHRRPEADLDPYRAATAEEEEEMKREIHLTATSTMKLYFEGDIESHVEEHFSRCGYGNGGGKESVGSEKGERNMVGKLWLGQSQSICKIMFRSLSHQRQELEYLM